MAERTSSFSFSTSPSLAPARSISRQLLVLSNRKRIRLLGSQLFSPPQCAITRLVVVNTLRGSSRTASPWCSTSSRMCFSIISHPTTSRRIDPRIYGLIRYSIIGTNLPSRTRSSSCRIWLMAWFQEGPRKARMRLWAPLAISIQRRVAIQRSRSSRVMLGWVMAEICSGVLEEQKGWFLATFLKSSCSCMSVWELHSHSLQGCSGIAPKRQCLLCLAAQ